MRKSILIFVLAIAVASVFTACASSRGGRGGCKMSQGYIGYGNSR